jgi:hypothetical protein
MLCKQRSQAKITGRLYRIFDKQISEIKLKPVKSQKQNQ